MPEQPLHLAKPTLAYAKLVATPTDLSWSQAYNAGSLFACLSLKQETTSTVSLPSLGKDIFNHLESEFFTLEEKNLANIKAAMEQSLQILPEGIIPSLCLVYVKEHILYTFLAGAGKIIMKRDTILGILLENNPAIPTSRTTMLTASGYLKNNDIVLLQTEQFAANLSEKDISQAFELALPNDIAEALSPKLHAKEDGGQAAIILIFHGFSQHIATSEQDESLEEAISEEKETYEPEEEPLSHEPKKQRLLFSLPSIIKTVKSTLRLPTLPSLRMNHKKKLFLSIAIVLVLLLTAAIVLTKLKQQTSQSHALFQQTYDSAQAKYNEGKALTSVRPAMAQTDFQKAQQTIADSLDTFRANSPEHTTLQNLLEQIQSQLTTKPATTLIQLKESTVPATNMLAVEKDNSGLAFAQSATSVYMLTNNAVSEFAKSGGKNKSIITNSNDWQDGVGIAPYEGNLYILDRKDGVLKYTSGSGGFGKTSYFKTSVDVSQAKAIAIDSSVYLLFQDGTLLKYTRGVADSFKVSGLDTPLSSPTKLFTDANTTSIYILDNGNSRVVKLGKDGSFQSQYPGAQIKDAKDFEVNESNKKILILEGGKIWELPL